MQSPPPRGTARLGLRNRKQIILVCMEDFPLLNQDLASVMSEESDLLRMCTVSGAGEIDSRRLLAAIDTDFVKRGGL